MCCRTFGAIKVPSVGKVALVRREPCLDRTFVALAGWKWYFSVACMFQDVVFFCGLFREVGACFRVGVGGVGGVGGVRAVIC